MGEIQFPSVSQIKTEFPGLDMSSGFWSPKKKYYPVTFNEKSLAVFIIFKNQSSFQVKWIHQIERLIYFNLILKSTKLESIVGDLVYSDNQCFPFATLAHKSTVFVSLSFILVIFS